jgi:UBX domain-containing protein 1/4
MRILKSLLKRYFVSVLWLSQIKPLTEEEKKAKLEELKAKMLMRKAEQAEKDRKEAKANEVGICLLGRNIDEIKTLPH